MLSTHSTSICGTSVAHRLPAAFESSSEPQAATRQAASEIVRTRSFEEVVAITLLAEWAESLLYWSGRRTMMGSGEVGLANRAAIVKSIPALTPAVSGAISLRESPVTAAGNRLFSLS
jgi:hypothetical protein